MEDLPDITTFLTDYSFLIDSINLYGPVKPKR